MKESRTSLAITAFLKTLCCWSWSPTCPTIMEPFSMAAKDYGGSKNKFIKALGSYGIRASRRSHPTMGQPVDGWLLLFWCAGVRQWRTEVPANGDQECHEKGETSADQTTDWSECLESDLKILRTDTSWIARKPRPTRRRALLPSTDAIEDAAQLPGAFWKSWVASSVSEIDWNMVGLCRICV